MIRGRGLGQRWTVRVIAGVGRRLVAVQSWEGMVGVACQSLDWRWGQDRAGRLWGCQAVSVSA